MADFRPIGVDSLDTVVDLDSATNGSRRKDFFVRRFQAQQKQPRAFISTGAFEAGELVGFACCHLLQGEFGSDELIAVLDALSVKPESQGHGVGHELMQQMTSEIRNRGARELHTQAGWNQPELLGFFASTGFRLAPSLILERATHDVRF